MMNPNMLKICDDFNLASLESPWIYKKWHKCWYTATESYGWMMLITLYDKRVNVYGNHLKWHVFNPDDKGVPWHEIPEWVKSNFEDWINGFIEQKIIVLSENE